MPEQYTPIAIDLDKLYDTFTSDEQIKESYDRRTVATGRYTFTATKAEAVEAGDKSPWPGRAIVRVWGKLTEVVDGAEKNRGNVGFDASWVLMRTDKGRADRPSKLWGQMVRAFGMEKALVRDVIPCITQYPLSAYVTEGFKTPEGSWLSARTADERADYKKKGYDARNFVDSVSKV